MPCTHTLPLKLILIFAMLCHVKLGIYQVKMCFDNLVRCDLDLEPCLYETHFTLSVHEGDFDPKGKFFPEAPPAAHSGHYNMTYA